MWSLHVSDRAPSDEGILKSWSITQQQYVFSGEGTSSPVRVNAIPTDNIYTCRIAGIYSDVSPYRQSESKLVGELVLGSLPTPPGNAEGMFSNLLQVIFGIRSWTSGSDGAKAEDSYSETEAKEARVAARGLGSPEAIPLFGALGSALLVVFVGLMGWRAGRSGRD